MLVLSKGIVNPMSREKLQFEVFSEGKSKEQKVDKKEVQEKQAELQQKTTSLAEQAKSAFAKDDLQTTLDKLRELQKAVLPESEAKRTEAIPETKLEGPVVEQIEVAIEKLGKENVFGPKEIEKIFGVRLAEVPGIPFSVEELERAEKLGQMLLLRVDKTAEGKPMSLEAMTEVMAKRWKDEGKGDLLSTADGWKSWIGEDRFTTESPRTGWALVSKDVLPESLSKNYIEQTEVIIATLKSDVFKDMDIPEEYTKAIAEFESRKAKLTELVGEDWKKAAKELTELKISQMTRQTFPETIYDLAVYYDVNNERLLSEKRTWSASLDPGGGLVSLGEFDADGVYGDGWSPGARNGYLGVSLSRRL